jgi:zinc-ribbon domain
VNASALPENVCPNCSEELPAEARFCPACGVPLGDQPPLETVPGPIAHERAVRRWLGLPVDFILLCLAFGALGAAIGLLATGGWAWGGVLLFVAVVLFLVLGGVETGRWTERPVRLATGGRAHAATAAEVWQTRFGAALTRWRTRSRLEQLDDARAPALQALGAAVWQGDEAAEREARSRLEELERDRERVEAELADHLAGAEERIRRARLPVDDTLMVTPDQPTPPYPPPDEGDPPQPAQVPEPYPPPDEGTPPTPAPAPDDE